MEKLIELFNNISPLTTKDKELLKKTLCSYKVNKAQTHSFKNTICKNLSFVTKGIFKVVKTDEKGNNYIPYFVTSGHFAVDIDSFSNNSMSDEEIIAITNCEIVNITKNDFILLEKEILNFSKTISTLKEQALIAKIKLKSEMLIDDATTKYHKLLIRQPEIIKYVSQNEISQHLGISQFTLSRIKSNK